MDVLVPRQMRPFRKTERAPNDWIHPDYASPMPMLNARRPEKFVRCVTDYGSRGVERRNGIENECETNVERQAGQRS